MADPGAKEITHRADEDVSWGAVLQRLMKTTVVHCGVEAMREGLGACKPGGDAPGIAVWACIKAASQRIPCPVCPLYRCPIHLEPVPMQQV
jgi:hypothetical protein